MNIQEIKAAINAKHNLAGNHEIKSLAMIRQMVKEGEEELPTEWLSHWDNDRRIRVTMHEEIFGKVKADPTFNTLAFKTEVVAEHPNKLDPTQTIPAYTRYVVIEPRNVEGVF